MNVDYAWKGIRAEGGHLSSQELGKDIPSPKGGGKTTVKEGIWCAVSQNRALAGVGKANRKNIYGAFKGGRYNESSLQKNKE